MSERRIEYLRGVIPQLPEGETRSVLEAELAHLCDGLGPPVLPRRSVTLSERRTHERRVWQYSFPSIDGLEGWAYIILREDGFFAAVSDYGNYAHLWTHHGHKDFREFFLRADWHYIAKKLKPEMRVDHAKSFRAVKEAIIQNRLAAGATPSRREKWTREFARAAWEHVELFEGGDGWDAFTYADLSYKLFDSPYEFTVRELCPDVVAFAKNTVCTRLRDVIKAELEGPAALPCPLCERPTSLSGVRINALASARGKLYDAEQRLQHTPKGAEAAFARAAEAVEQARRSLAELEGSS